MLTLFLELIDRLIALFREHSANKDRLFHDEVEPLFQKSTAAANDLIAFCRAAGELYEKSLSGDEADLRAALKDLRASRDAAVLRRIEVTALADLLTNAPDADVQRSREGY